jgi:hypothetical protein
VWKVDSGSKGDDRIPIHNQYTPSDVDPGSKAIGF